MIANGWGIDAEPRTSPLQGNLAFTIKNVTNLLPMHHILALEDRNARKILEG